MLILLAATMLSGMVMLRVAKHRRQEQEKALVLVRAEKRRRQLRQQRNHY